MKFVHDRRWFAVIALTTSAGVSNCGVPSSETIGSPQTPGCPGEEPAQLSVQIAEVMRRVHFGFRESPDGFGGSHGSYISNVSRSGSVTVTPYPDASPHAALEKAWVGVMPRAS